MVNGGIKWYAINTWCKYYHHTIVVEHQKLFDSMKVVAMEHWTQFEIRKLVHCVWVAFALIKWMDWWVIICHMEALLLLFIHCVCHHVYARLCDVRPCPNERSEKLNVSWLVSVMFVHLCHDGVGRYNIKGLYD